MLASNPKNCEKMILEGIEAMNEKNFSKSLKLLTTSRNIARENKWFREEFLATNNIGANYYMMLDYGEALKNYLEAYKIAVTNLDEKSEMTVLNNIAILYSKDNNLKKAKEYFFKAYNLAVKTGKTTSKSKYAVNLATIHNETKEYKIAEKYIDEALPLLINSPFLLNAKAVKVDIMVNLIQNQAAEKLALEILPQMSGAENDENRTNVYFDLSLIAENNGDLQKAFHYMKLAEKSNRNYDFNVNIFQRYSTLYKKINNNELPVLYKDSVIIVKDSLNKIKNGQLFGNSQIKFELKNSQQNLAESYNKVTSQRTIFISGILLAIFIICIIVWALRNSILKNRQQKIIEQNNAEIARLELEKEKENKKVLENQLKENKVRAQMDEEKYKYEIENKNRKLTTKALQLSSKIELIDDLIQTLSRQVDDVENQNISKIIQQLKILQRQSRDEEGFFTHFDEVNQGFIAKLKTLHPHLNSNDIRFLSYVYMNLSMKEISSLLNITVEACRKRKERIIKKIDQNENTDLYRYVTGI